MKIKHYHLFRKLLSNDYKGFIDEKTDKEKQEMEEKFNLEKWKEVMEYIIRINLHRKRKCLITKRSYKLSQKIELYTGIEIFPVIVRKNLGDIHNEEAYWTWSMYSINMLEYGGSESPSSLILKKNKIKLLEDGFHTELFAVKK